jgi:hypothetical protein
MKLTLRTPSEGWKVNLDLPDDALVRDVALAVHRLHPVSPSIHEQKIIVGGRWLSNLDEPLRIALGPVCTSF